MGGTIYNVYELIFCLETDDILIRSESMRTSQWNRILAINKSHIHLDNFSFSQCVPWVVPMYNRKCQDIFIVINHVKKKNETQHYSRYSPCKNIYQPKWKLKISFHGSLKSLGRFSYFNFQMQRLSQHQNIDKEKDEEKKVWNIFIIAA